MKNLSQQPAILIVDIKIIIIFTIVPPDLVVLGSYHSMNFTLLCTESIMARLVRHLTCNDKNSHMSALNGPVGLVHIGTQTLHVDRLHS